jgi:carotenoid phi-ring synthase / carotenoid chi-ring synthase
MSQVSPQPKSPSVVIIGAGVAGLTAALHLAERGVQPMILEADPVAVGGRLRDDAPVTLQHAGATWSFPSEHGVHGIWTPYVNFKAALARHNLLPELFSSPDEAWIHAEGRRVRSAAIGRVLHTGPLPAPFHYLHLFSRPRFFAMLSPLDLVTIPRVFGTLLVALGIDPITEQNPLHGQSLADFTRGWSPRLRSFFAGLARNALAAHPEDVPAAGFIAFLRFYTISRRDAWAFGFLPGTGGTVVEPLALEVQRLGADLRLGVRATQLAQHNAGWSIQTATPDGVEAQLETPLCILATDAPAAAALLRASPATAAAAERLWFPTGIPTAIFRLWFGVKPRTPASSGIFSGDFTVDNFFWLDHFQPAYAEWGATTGGSAIEMHIYGPPEVLARPDAVLLAQAIKDAALAFPETSGRLLHATLTRNPATHTLFSVGGPGEHLAVETPWPGLFACGDWVAHPSPALYLERAATTGIAAANEALLRLGHDQWPILPHPAPEAPARRIGEWIGGLRRWVRRRRSEGR